VLRGRSPQLEVRIALADGDAEILGLRRASVDIIQGAGYL
jgi:hypothetical protein